MISVPIDSERALNNYLEKGPVASSKVIVVGAGLSGLVAAERLRARGCDVTVIDKARGPGGRMSTRRESAASFNHGAQYFTASSELFRSQVAQWLDQELIREFTARIAVIDQNGIKASGSGTRRYVAVPGMNQICKNLASRLSDVRYNWKVVSAEREVSGWRLVSEQNDCLESDWLIVTLPPEQALGLLGSRISSEDLSAVEMQPCWSVMAELSAPLLENWDAAFVNQGPLSWICSQSNYLHSSQANDEVDYRRLWVLHATTDWSRQNLEQGSERICEELLQAAAELSGFSGASVIRATGHRWRYSVASQPLQAGALHYPADNLVLAGDWCQGSRVEGAYLSGLAASQ